MHDGVTRYLAHDRDLELRRSMAERHARAALEAADRVAIDSEASSHGLAEAGRALALDPANVDAKRAMLRLLTEPPPTLPPEPQRLLDEERDRRRRASSAMGVMMAVPFFAFLVPMLVGGIADRTSFAAYYGSVVALLVGLVLVWRAKRPGNGGALVLCALTNLLTIAAATIFGPLIVVPQYALMNIVIFLWHLDRFRWAPLVMSLAALGLPLAAQGLGVVASTYRFEAGTLVVVPHMLAFSKWPTMVLLTAMSVVHIAIAAVIVGEHSRSTQDAQRRLVFQAWQLRHVLPTPRTDRG